MRDSKDSNGALLVDAKSIPLWLGMNCIVPSQQYYEDACRVRYQELLEAGIHVDKRVVEKCINNVRYTFSTMRSTRLIYEAGTRSTVFLPCILFFYEAYGEKWREKFTRYLSSYVHPLYSSEDIQYLHLDEKELDNTLIRACKLAEKFPELKALIANLIEHYKAMRQLYNLVGNVTIYDKLDNIFEEVKHEQTRSIDNLRFQMYSLLSKQNSILMHLVEVLVSLLVIESLRVRGYLDSWHALNLYFEVVRDALKDQRVRSIIESLRVIHGSLSRVLQLVEDILRRRYAGESKGMANTRSIARKMLVSFVVSRSLMSAESVRTLLLIVQASDRRGDRD